MAVLPCLPFFELKLLNRAVERISKARIGYEQINAVGRVPFPIPFDDLLERLFDVALAGDIGTNDDKMGTSKNPWPIDV